MLKHTNTKLLATSVLALSAALMIGASLMPVSAVEQSRPHSTCFAT
jgi:hypothetical protein